MGKTESVKALGALGRFVFVFCCDESFDIQTIGRIFVGLCQIGAWGCFDDSNRLEKAFYRLFHNKYKQYNLG